MAKRIPRTNKAFISKLMDHPNALVQAFVITAIDKYAQQCIKAGAAEFNSGLLNGQAWINAATTVKDAVQQQYGE